jgi:WS/DGAT/MGAT family acyltransferase
VAAPSIETRHLSDVEALMWNLEKDPYLLSTMANITLFDRPPDIDRLRRRLVQATIAVPRLRKRVAPAFGRLAPPSWQEDPDFDIDRHLRVVGLPQPGTLDQLLDLAATLAKTPFDRTRPLWEFVVVEGLADGRGAMVQRMHHTITDGEGGIRMSIAFIDLERDAPEPPDPEPPVEEDLAVAGNLVSSLTQTVDHNVRRIGGMTRRVAGSAADAVVHPSKLIGAPGQAWDVATALLRQAQVDPRRSPLWTERSLKRRLAIFSIPFDDAKRTAKDWGGSINDLFVTGAAGGAGAYHRQLGAEVDELRMAMPVSTRTDKTSLGNAFTPTRVLVPTTADPRERFDELRERLAVTRSDRSVGLYGALAGVANLLPTSVVVRVARSQTETVDFTTSNVKAAPFDLYIAGALLLANHPIGPLGGTAFNLTTMSYRGKLEMGLHMDAGAIEQPDLLESCMIESFEEILGAGR